jgi:hypothetical protein
MPQRDNRVSRRFGKLPAGLWETLGQNPGRQCEQALEKYFHARKRGKRLPPFPAAPTGGFGQARSIWLKPEVRQEMDAIADAEGVTYTAVLLAALIAEHGPEIMEPPPNIEPPKRRGRPRKPTDPIQSAPMGLSA